MKGFASGEFPDREDEFIQGLLCRLYDKHGMRSWILVNCIDERDMMCYPTPVIKP